MHTVSRSFAISLLQKFCRLSRKERPDGSGPAFAWDDVSIPIRPHYRAGIRFLHRSLPALPMGFPCGRLSGLHRRKYGLTTFHIHQRCGLGLAFAPAVLCPCIPKLERDNQLRYRFGSGFSAALACCRMTTLISDSRYIDHTTQAVRPDRLAAGSLSPLPHGFGLSLSGRGYKFHIMLPRSRCQLLW